MFERAFFIWLLGLSIIFGMEMLAINARINRLYAHRPTSTAPAYDVYPTGDGTMVVIPKENP